MARYIPDGSCQTLFVNGSLDSLLPESSVARSIWRGVCDLDFSGFDAKYRNDAEGRPAIDPRRLAGAWILAMVRGVSSSVAVARLCQTDIEFRWLSGDAGVQKSTLSDFRTRHFKQVCGLSTQILAALARSGMLPGEELAIDGSVIRAAASCQASCSRRKLNAGKTAVTYQATAAVCQECRCKPECCPGTHGGRSVNRPLYDETMKAVAERVNSERGKRYWKARSVVVEGAIGRLVELLHWRRCRTWGKVGAQAEALWRQITHNLMLLIGYWKPLVLKGAPSG